MGFYAHIPTTSAYGNGYPMPGEKIRCPGILPTRCTFLYRNGVLGFSHDHRIWIFRYATFGKDSYFYSMKRKTL